MFNDARVLTLESNSTATKHIHEAKMRGNIVHVTCDHAEDH